MSYDFHVGQMVVCVDDAPRKHPMLSPCMHGLKRGCVYTIKWVGPANNAGLQYVGVHLVEVIRPENRGGVRVGNAPGMPFQSRRFRPVKKTSIEIFEKLLNPTEREVIAVTSSPVAVPSKCVDHRASQLANLPHPNELFVLPPGGSKHLAPVVADRVWRAPSLIQLMSSAKSSSCASKQSTGLAVHAG